MTISSEFDSLGSNAVGIYRQNALYMKITSLFDLNASDELTIPFAIAMNAHEYVHFLHNISTTQGQYYLLENLLLLRAMTSGCDAQGFFLGVEKMEESNRNFLQEIAQSMSLSLGTTKLGEITNCKNISSWDYSYPTTITINNINFAKSTFSAIDKDNNCKSQEVR